MTKRSAQFFVFFFGLTVLYGQSPAGSLAPIDGVVKSLAADIPQKIPAGGSPKIALGQWSYHDSVPAFGLYWAAQLAEELTNIPGRSFVLATGPGGSDWTLSGEIIGTPGIIRVYTRLLRSADFSIAASFHTDFEVTEYIAEMLSGGGGRNSPSVVWDAYESDSMENPLAVEIADNADGPVISRSIHTERDDDFFLLAPAADGILTLETTGSTDTYMELYDADSRNILTSNDDGGYNSNARIRWEVRSGNRYIAQVYGYDHDVTGSYGFHAWLVEPVRMDPDEFEDDNEFESAKNLIVGTPQQHTFTTGEDVDWVQFQISRAGRYTIRARGVNSSALDTYIELYDKDRNAIDDNDDGGEDYDSLLSVRLQTGTYYLKIECLDDEPDQPYTVRVDAE